MTRHDRRSQAPAPSETDALRAKIGQKFVVGFPGTTLTDEIRELITRYKVGNIILFRENLVDAEQTAALCGELRDLILEATGEVPFISIDQEGGIVTRLADDTLNIPGAMALAAADDLTLTRAMNRINGRVLRALGFNLNLAPVADINCEPDNPVIGVRSYGDDPEAVARQAEAAFEGLRAGGIPASAKHFPGHGDTKVDSHVGLPLVDADRETLETRELYPFRRLADAGIDAVMTTHILFPALEPEKIPATMSRRILTDLLRHQYGFEGLIISDCMEMKAIATHYGTTEGVLRAFDAGVDLVFISHTPRAAVEAMEAALEAYGDGTLDPEALDRSHARILKHKAALSTPDMPDDADYDAMRAAIREALPRTLTPVGAPLPQGDPARTVAVGPLPVRGSNVANKALAPVSFARDMAEALGGTGLVSSARPDAEEIDRLTAKIRALRADGRADLILFGSDNAHVYTEQLALKQALLDLGIPMILVALRNPYDLMYLPEGEAAVCTYEYTPKILETLADDLRRGLAGEARTATGTLPVKLP